MVHLSISYENYVLNHQESCRPSKHSQERRILGQNIFFNKYQYHMNFIVYELILFIGQRSN